MGRVVFVGGGFVGMCAATMLANDGHEVTVLERDATPPPQPDTAWGDWDRRGVNQFRLMHFLLPRFRQVADVELPGLTDAMVAAGALRMNPMLGIPDEITGGWREGDERFESVTARRPVGEAVVAAFAAGTAGVTIRRGVAVVGLLTTAGPDVARPRRRRVVAARHRGEGHRARRCHSATRPESCRTTRPCRRLRKDTAMSAAMKQVVLGDLTFAVQDEGEGPAVVLLHGFPDSHNLWRHQVPALVAAGYRVIAPDLRGFGDSSKPVGVERYGILDLVGDVLGILDSAGVQRAHVVGHDWGSALAWVTAAFAPDRVDHLVAMSVGHPLAFSSVGLAQREKSWYMLLFQFEEIAEQWLSANDFANFRAWSSHPDVDQVVETLARPGALTAGLNVYRANVHPRTWVQPPLAFPQVQANTMGVWSSGDFALIEAGMTSSNRFVDGSWRYERIDGAGHWMQLEAADQLNALLLDFLPKP